MPHDQRSSRKSSARTTGKAASEAAFHSTAPSTSLSPELLATTRSTLASGAGALGLTLPAQALDQLLAYLQLLLRWNRVYNLTAVRDPADMAVQHLLDSLAALPALDRHHQNSTSGATTNPALRILDVGSGGGLPGVVWAAARPEHQITCVDAVAKKTTFVRQVAAELRLTNLRAEHARVEALKLPAFPLITARAFASLADIVNLTAPLLATEGVWMAMKGQMPTDEIAALPDEIEVFHVEQLRVPGMDADRCIVWMRRRSSVDPLPRALLSPTDQPIT